MGRNVGKIFIIFCLIISNFKISASSNYVEKQVIYYRLLFLYPHLHQPLFIKIMIMGPFNVKNYWKHICCYAFLKRIINKERPNGGGLGFPSGHTSSAFSGAALEQKI